MSGPESAALAHADEAVGGRPEARAFLVARAGRLVHEAYYHGHSADVPRNVKSVTKSVQSALVGIAIADGSIAGLDARLADLVPGVAGGALGEASVRDLLTMRSGVEGSDFDAAYNVRMMRAPDQLAFASTLERVDEPGRTFRYNTANAMVLNGVIAAATGRSPLDFANDRLFGPLGFAAERWRTDDTGLHVGGSDLHLTARQMLRFGMLLLQRGSVDRRSVLPADFVEASLSEQVPREALARDPAAALLPGRSGYGLLWWRRDAAGQAMTCAWGLGGQLVCLVPSVDLVAVLQSTIDLNQEYHHELFAALDLHLVSASR